MTCKMFLQLENKLYDNTLLIQNCNYSPSGHSKRCKKPTLMPTHLKQTRPSSTKSAKLQA